MSKEAKWICHPQDGDENRLVPVFQKKLNIKPGLLSATLALSAHGIYEAQLNGQAVTDHKFTPGLTSYYYRIQVQTYDVTALLHEGENLWQTTVGDGWWRWNSNYGFRLALWGKLELSYADGSTETIGTDETFDVGTGPVACTDLQKGETYDARIAPGNWVKAALETEHTDAERIPQQGVPVREKERFAGKLIKDSEGNLIIDFGQNIAGYVHMVLQDTKPGQIIRLKHGEGLDLEGKFSTDNCSGGITPFQEVTYICKGAEREEYCPHFTWFGFRYALIEGVDSGEFTAVALYSDMEETGDFCCSNPLINQLVKNARWSQKGNFLDVPTDCPTREKNAWTGDAQIYINTAAYFMDAEQFYKKWLVDQRIEQYESGKVGITFPSTSSVHNPAALKRGQERDSSMALAGPTGDGNIGEDSVGWGDSAVWLPYQLYLMYGDKQIIADHYETAKRWLEYSLSCMKEVNPRFADREWYQNGDGDYIYDTRFHYGEWLEPMPPHPEVLALFLESGSLIEFIEKIAKRGKPEVATAYTKRSCDNLAHMAEILGKVEDAAHYRSLSEKIKAAYNKYLIAPDGEIQKGHQAAYIRALALDMVDDEKKSLVIAQLKQELENADYHLNTGFLSTVYLLPTLCDNGLTEEAFRILEQTSAPGWLHPVIMGATTILENWNGMDDFKDSFNHYSLGAVCQFLFEYVAGIRPTFDAPGFEKIILKPVPGGSLTWAEGAYKTRYGMIRSGWKIENGSFIYHCTVPEGTTADLHLPDSSTHELHPGDYIYKINWEV